MVNISTGHKARSKPADLVRTRGIGMGTAPVAAGETGSVKVSTQNWSHLQKSQALYGCEYYVHSTKLASQLGKPDP